MALLKYLPLPSLNPATQSPSYLIKMCKLAVVRTLITVMLMLVIMMTTLLFRAIQMMEMRVTPLIPPDH